MRSICNPKKTSSNLLLEQNGQRHKLEDLDLFISFGDQVALDKLFLDSSIDKNNS